jgi:hypothetical protein
MELDAGRLDCFAALAMTARDVDRASLIRPLRGHLLPAGEGTRGEV